MQQRAAAVCLQVHRAVCTHGVQVVTNGSMTVDPSLVPSECLGGQNIWSPPPTPRRDRNLNKKKQSNVFYPYASLSSWICKCNKTIFIHEYRLNSDNFIFPPMKMSRDKKKREKELFQANGSTLIAAKIFCWQAQSRWYACWNANSWR